MGLTRKIALTISAGDQVWIAPLWNRTSRPNDWVAPGAEVLKVITDGGHSQTGVLLRVTSREGGLLDLDAGWFTDVKYRPKKTD